MDNLTELKGVGKSTAKLLTAAGFDRFDKLAAAKPDERPEGLPERVDFEDLISQAWEIVTTTSAASGNSDPESDDDKGGDSDLGPDSDFEVLQVIGPKKGRWRAGRHFTPEASFLKVSELGEQDIAAIVADPVLTSAFMALDVAEELQKKAG